MKHPNWKYLASKISGSISSDGEIPNSVNLQTRQDLEKLSKQALEHIEKRLTGKIISDNLSLRFLTWQFKLCPAELSKTLIDLWPYREKKGFRHPFITSPNSWVLFFQGVGRIVVFSASEHLKIMAKSKGISGDSTFRISTRFWTQVFVISVEIETGVFIPVAFALFPWVLSKKKNPEI